MVNEIANQIREILGATAGSGYNKRDCIAIVSKNYRRTRISFYVFTSSGIDRILYYIVFK